MFFLGNQNRIAVSVLLALSLSACGGQATPMPTAAPTTKAAPLVPANPVPNPHPSSEIPAPLDVSSDPSKGELSPDFASDFSIKGNGSLNGSLPPTDNHLYVGIKALATGTIDNYPNYTITYNCIKFAVKIGASSQTVFVSTTGADISAPGNPCDGAKAVDIRNFDKEVQQGHNALSIKVTPMAYDNCRLYGNIWNGGCPLNNVYSTHIVSGNILVYTNNGSKTEAK